MRDTPGEALYELRHAAPPVGKILPRVRTSGWRRSRRAGARARVLHPQASRGEDPHVADHLGRARYRRESVLWPRWSSLWPFEPVQGQRRPRVVRPCTGACGESGDPHREVRHRREPVQGRRRVAVLAAEVSDPEAACMPLFEPERWPRWRSGTSPPTSRLVSSRPARARNARIVQAG